MKVSCLCPTFARAELLNEAIYSFLNQDFLGEKELIILNDYSEQNLRINHPEINIINLTGQLPSLGYKRNLLCQLANGDILFPWDDDDIHLPWRISTSLEYMEQIGCEFFNFDRALHCNNNIIQNISFNTFHTAGCYTKSLWKKTGGYGEIDSGDDSIFEASIKQYLKKNRLQTIPNSINEVYYIYRWGGTNSYHISVMNQKSLEYIKDKNIPKGIIKLNPVWSKDWIRESEKFFAGG